MSDEKVFAVVLAAGEASRFGKTKQLQEFRGEALVTRAVRCAEDACGSETVLVTGSDWRQVADACAPLRGYFVINPAYAAGLAGSLACGVRSVAEVADAVIIMLADQPLVTPAHLQSLVACWHESPESIVASAYAGTSGPPVVFPRLDFAALLDLSGDQGAKRVIEANSKRVKLIQFEEAAIDIDRPEDVDAG